MLTLDIRTNLPELIGQITDLQTKKIPEATLKAAQQTGRYVYAALRSEMDEVFDRPTPWAKQAVQITEAKPVFTVYINETPNKGIPGSKFLAAELEGGPRRHKRFEVALIAKGLMPADSYAVPGAQAPLDQYGNVPGSFIVRVLSDLQAFGEGGYRANRRGPRKGARRSNYFFVPPRGGHLRPGVYWHMPNHMLACVFAFVPRATYARRYDFYGVAQRAYERVANRFLREQLEAIRGIEK